LLPRKKQTKKRELDVFIYFAFPILCRRWVVTSRIEAESSTDIKNKPIIVMLGAELLGFVGVPLGEVGAAVVEEGWVGVEAVGWGWFLLEDDVLGCVFVVDVVCRF
jgi:hypothetical protein